MPKFKNVSGQRFGRLLAIDSLAGSRTARRKWRCLCDCGQEAFVDTCKLLSGHTRSCGCLQRDSVAAKSTTHGGQRRSEYSTWKGIKSRCFNPNSPAFANYGARGISMCPEWADDFSAFLRDMGPRPSVHHTVERKDNSLGYSPDNCLWATRKEQSRNKRNNRWICSKGAFRTLAEWAEVTGIPAPTLASRLDRLHWSVDKAFNTPLNATRNKARAKRDVEKSD